MCIRDRVDAEPGISVIMQYIMLYSKFTEDYVQQNLAYPKVLTNGVGQPYEALHMILTPDKKYFTQTLDVYKRQRLAGVYRLDADSGKAESGGDAMTWHEKITTAHLAEMCIRDRGISDLARNARAGDDDEL